MNEDVESLKLAIALLESENMRLQIYRKAIHEICGYRMASPTGYIMLAKQTVDWYEELSDEAMEKKLKDDRLMQRSWIYVR